MRHRLMLLWLCVGASSNLLWLYEYTESPSATCYGRKDRFEVKFPIYVYMPTHTEIIV